jgi:hypothetical protein
MVQFADKINNDLKMSDPTKTEGDQQINSTTIYAACDRECTEAYSDEIFKRACLDGCKHQTPAENGQVRVVVDSNSPFFPYANKLINDAVGQFGDFREQMKSHWDKLRQWMSTDDGADNSKDDAKDDAKIVKSLQNMGDSLLKLFRGFDNDQPNPFVDQQKQKPKLFGGPEDVADHVDRTSGKPRIPESHPKHVDGSEFTGSSGSIGNMDENGEPIIIVHMIPVDLNEDDGNSKSSQVSDDAPTPPETGDAIYGDADDGWMACLARRTQNLSILSRWMLCFALMLSILRMFWLCLALMRTQRQRQRRHRLYSQYRAGKSNVIYFTPPPIYEKTPSSAAYVPLNNDEKKKQAPPSPPPAYHVCLDGAGNTEAPKSA